jgi:hypothetical protein
MFDLSTADRLQYQAVHRELAEAVADRNYQAALRILTANIHWLSQHAADDARQVGLRSARVGAP